MSATPVIDKVSERTLVMAYSWEGFLDCLARREHGRAEGHYGLYLRLDQMTDIEYSVVTTCDKEECNCHK